MKAEFFKNNRQRLLTEVGSGALIVVAGYREMQRSNDTAFPFEQEANFWYLSGIEAPDWRLIIDGKRGRSYAVSPIMSKSRQIFDGSLSWDDARQISGVDEIIATDEADSLLTQLRREHPLAYMVEENPVIKQHVEFVFNSAQQDLHNYLSHRFENVRDCRREVSMLRAVKHPEEISMIQKAIDITAVGFKTISNNLKKYAYEYEVEAQLNYEFRCKGAFHAYSPIVSHGLNACTLHYVKNSDKIMKPSLLLIDAGAKYGGYCADITRSFAFGRTTKRQRDIYNAVEDIQQQCIDAVRPGLAIGELQQLAEHYTAESLKLLGLYQDDESVLKYCPHLVSHSLGVDVHDTFGGYEALQENMVLTIEPGIYVPQEAIGVRIEDNVQVTTSGSKVLSRAISREL